MKASIFCNTTLESEWLCMIEFFTIRSILNYSDVKVIREMRETVFSHQIRETFLNFFKKKNHLLIPSASLLPQNDPTLLYINSGMAPLKKYFLGLKQPPHPRLCNVQLCIRTGDIEDAGDRHHFTSFEMLGSWSINDYYKEAAIELAYELLVEEFNFPIDKLYATVYGGNPTLDIPPDEESIKAWEKVGLPREHIVILGEDNFWGPAGETGPCGPCTEVFFDTGDHFGEAYETNGIFDTTSRYIEIWNAGVFMELDKKADGSFERLPLRIVDTGSGLERMAMVMNSCNSLYDIDLIEPIMTCISQQLTGKSSSVLDYKIISDHLKTATFILSEGVLPSNEGQGYIPRRLIRKCAALATRSGVSDFDYRSVVNQVVDIYKDYYPNLHVRQSKIIENIQREVKEFEQTAKKGLERLDSLLLGEGSILSGKNAFELVTTYGVPFELIQLFTEQRGRSIDNDDYVNHFRRHQEVSRQEGKAKAGSVVKNLPFEELKALIEGVTPTLFVGYETVETQGEILLLLKDGMRVKTVVYGDTNVQIVTSETSFYAESGGQVADTGVVIASHGKANVIDTLKIDEVFIHHVNLIEGIINVGDQVELKVDELKRRQLKANHSATHLLHSALRQVLGESIIQKGSLIDPDHLRFDFQYSSALTKEEVVEIEKLVNSWIWQNLKANIQVMDYKDALTLGYLALFTEKYGDRVRVLELGDVSRELCGGTHVDATGEIGSFLIVSERSIAKGIRRIEAVTRDASLKLAQNRSLILKESSKLLKTSQSNFLERLKNLIDSGVSSKKKSDDFANNLTEVKGNVSSLKSGVTIFTGRLDDVKHEILRREALVKIGQKSVNVVCLAGKKDNAVQVVIAVAPNFSDRLNASYLLKELLHLIDGKGGGNAQFAQGGGKKTQGINALFRALLQKIETNRKTL
jgi:alanyl-tRNA synthetase